MKTSTPTLSTPPPAVPIHYTETTSPVVDLNIAIIQPQYETSKIKMDPPSLKRPTYLGQKQQQQPKKKRNSQQQQADILLDGYDSATSSSDESEGGYSNRFSSQSFNSNPTEEHKFWQVHSSTTIISPPTAGEAEAISMDYVPRIKTPASRIPLAIQIHNMLASTFDEVDEEIEREWESSRTQLKTSLIVLPTISLHSPTF